MKMIHGSVCITDLTVGGRISYIRKIRGMTQQELGDAVGLDHKTARNMICRYEQTGRVPRGELLSRIAAALDVSINMIREYDFNDPRDMYYLILWSEEICPDYSLGRTVVVLPGNDTHKFFSEKYFEWQKKRRSFRNGEISHLEYFNWKMGV